MKSQINKLLFYLIIISKKIEIHKDAFLTVQVNPTITVINKERFFIFNNILQSVIANIDFIKSFENEIEDNNEKNAVFSAINFLIKSILWPMFFRQTSRQRGS